MDDFESYLSKANDKQLKLWSETTRSVQQKEARPAKLPPLRVSPKRSPKSGPPEQNKFVRKADYLINVSRDKAEYKDRISDGEKKYSGSLYEAFAGEVNQVEKHLPIPKRDAKLIWAKVAESDIVPCVPDIFLKIACTDDCAPYAARDSYITYARVYEMGLRIDLRTILGALLIPTQFRFLLKESQMLRKFYHLVHLHTRTLIQFRTFRLLLLEAVHRREVKKLQISLGTLPEDEMDKIKKSKGKRKKGKKDNSGKLLEEYFMQAIYRQKSIVDKFLEIRDNKDIVMWGLATEIEKES